MALERKPACEKCERALPPRADARICSDECTFCPACPAAMNDVCPSCGGDLAARPRRTR